MRRKMKFLIILYLLLLSVLLFFSYGFVDPNLTLSSNVFYQKLQKPLSEIVFNNKPLSTAIFIFIIGSLFLFYFLFSFSKLKKRLKVLHLKRLILITAVILFFSYPAFSYDIFNYILTAKTTFLYRENPYIVMPIEILGEPNLLFTRAANKIALYGPSWIGMTLIPHLLGIGNILLTIFSFKLLVILFYLATSWLIFKLTKNVNSVSLFALNPLVVIETLVSGHNDIVMMFFALLAFYLLKKKNILIACLPLSISILVKYATVALIPIFFYVVYQTFKKSDIDWNKTFALATISMLIAFAISPIREEIYSWYVIWTLSFVVLVPKQKFLLSLAITLSFATLLRYVPVLYTGSYFGITPMVKKLVTFVPLSLFGIFWIWEKLTLRNT